MFDKITVLNRDFDPRAGFQRAVLDLLVTLDATGCEIASRIAEAMIDFSKWDPVGPNRR